MLRSLLSAIPAYIIRMRGALTLCVALLFAFSVRAQTPQGQQAAPDPTEVKVQQLNQQALIYMNQYKYDDALKVLNEAVKLRENASSYYYIGHIALINNEWEDAVKNCEKAVQLDPTAYPAYSDLFFGYIKTDRWNDAQNIEDKARKGETNGAHTMEGQITYLESLLADKHRSSIFLFLCIAVFAIVFFYPLYNPQSEAAKLSGEGAMRFSELLLISAAVNCLLYYFFFSIAHWAWAQNPHIPPSEFAIGIRGSTFEHDGAESFVLYFLMFVSMFLTLVATPLLLRLRSNKGAYYTVFSALFVVTAYYFFKIGFYPPFPTVDAQYLYLPFVMALLSIGLYVAYQKNSILVKVIAVALSAYCGLVTLAPPSAQDLSYVVAPALRLYHGFKVTEIYFQYDLFLSFLAYAWMKMHWALEYFPYTGTISFFLFFVGSFFFVDKFSRTRGLSAMFIIAIILIRLYIQDYDNPVIYQVAPLRLDLWLILLLVANAKGVHHWLVSLFVGLLVLFHRNLGLIYFGAYIELLIVLFVIDIFNLVADKNLTGKTIRETVVKHFKLNIINLVIVISSIALCYILFKELFSESAIMYRKLGFGMLPISRISFYWYVPVVMSIIAVILFFYRKKLGEKYVSVGIFLLLLTVGNSMYFFGRSHENNVLNIAGILTIMLFMLFDLLIYLAPEQVQPVPVAQPGGKDKGRKAATPASVKKANWITPRNLCLALPVIFIGTTSYFYSERIVDKSAVQYNNMLESNYVFPFPFTYMDTTAANRVVQGNRNVYFLDPYYDFYFYYYGNFTPPGYYNPTAAWIYKNDQEKFIQGLLDKHYCVVYNVRNLANLEEYIANLHYNHTYQVNDMVAISEENVPLLLPQNSSPVMHIGIKDSIVKGGMDFSNSNIGSSFTMEFIVKPMGLQMKNACVINNLSQFPYEGFRGFTLQLNNEMQDQFLFGFSNGTNAVPFSVFRLEPGRWSYVGVSVTGGGLMKIFVNGKPAAILNAGGTPLPDSQLPITIGNRNSRDAHFNGLIREVSISNGNIDDAELISRGQKIDAELNGSATPANP